MASSLNRVIPHITLSCQPDLSPISVDCRLQNGPHPSPRLAFSVLTKICPLHPGLIALDNKISIPKLARRLVDLDAKPTLRASVPARS